MTATITNRDLAAVILILAFFALAGVYIINDISARIRAEQFGIGGAAADSLGFDGTATRTALGADDALGDAA